MALAKATEGSGRPRSARALSGLHLALALALTAGQAAAAETGPSAEPIRTGKALSIELNKLESREQGCRAYLVFDNRSPRTFESLRLDLILFGTDGVIARRLAVDAGPLRPKKTSVKLFDIANLPCDGIGQVLLNDIPVCEREGQAGPADCMDGVAVSSRVARAPFIQ